MASFLEELNKLTNPAPVFRDPEDDVDDETSARVVIETESAHHEKIADVETGSKLRQKNIIPLGDLDKKYRGRKTNRKSLQENSGKFTDLSKTAILEKVISPATSDDETAESDEEEHSEDDQLDINSFRERLKLKTSGKRIDDQLVFEDDDDGRDDDDDMDEDDESENEDDSEESSDETDDNKDNDQEAEMDDVSKFSKTDITEDIEKGTAAKHQIGMWDSLLEARIKLQKSLAMVNQLPQPETWPVFVAEGGDNFEDVAVECQSAVKNLLDNLVQLQTLLLVSNPETKHVVSGKAGDLNSKMIDSDDEEITSESENEETPAKESKPKSPEKGQLKRKLKSEDYPEFLAKRHSDFTQYRNGTIQKWSDKTRLAMGKFNSKSFSAFEQSALKQIEQILADQDRLVKRTQLKRTAYRVLGRKETHKEDQDEADMTETQESNSSREQLVNHDEEIFDDDDFYHQLLRELIERKTIDISDPIALSRQWLEIQRLRTKVKKKIDTKASKGRKIRYDAHKKLVNFMAPMDSSTWPQESRDDLFKSLFGKRFGSSTADVNR